MEGSLMERMIGLLLIILLIAGVSPLNLSNAYLRADDFDVVTVKSGENVWSIAEKYAVDDKSVRDLATAIREINALDNDARIEAGQKIKVPMIDIMNSKVKFAQK
jgi:hypothetical protein